MSYFAPTTLDDAIAILAERDACVIAGGTDFFPALGDRPVDRDLLDITRVADLDGIDRTDTGWRIGATTRWTDIVRADLPAGFAGLQAAALEVGSLQIQNAGTIAGNICNASPAADGVPGLLTLDAEVEVSGPEGQRRVPLSGFLTGPRQTCLQPGELVSALHVPEIPDHAIGAFDKLGSRKYLVISITMVAAIVGCDDTGAIDFARIAVGACSPVALRLPGLERDVIGKAPGEILVEPGHLSALSPISDVRGKAEYRLEVVAEQIRRILIKAGGGNG